MAIEIPEATAPHYKKELCGEFSKYFYLILSQLRVVFPSSKFWHHDKLPESSCLQFSKKENCDLLIKTFVENLFLLLLNFGY